MSNTTISSSSAGYNFINAINLASRYVYPVTIVLTIVTNTLNLSILLRRSLRTSSCTQYFLALSMGSLVYILFTPLNIFLSSTFGISLTNVPVGCSLLSFLVNSTALFYTSMLVCASIDRFLTSSSALWLRNLSSVRMAKRIIAIVCVLILSYMSPFIVINYWNSNTSQCAQSTSTLVSIYLSSRIIIYNVLGPLLMALFGLLTIRNIRKQRNRVNPVVFPVTNRRREGQLTRVLLLQVAVNLIFCLPNAVTYIISTFFPTYNAVLVTGIRLLSIMWQQGVHFVSIFLYILSATAFRKELKKVFKMNRQNDQRPNHFLRGRGQGTLNNSLNT